MPRKSQEFESSGRGGSAMIVEDGIHGLYITMTAYTCQENRFEVRRPQDRRHESGEPDSNVTRCGTLTTGVVSFRGELRLLENYQDQTTVAPAFACLR